MNGVLVAALASVLFTWSSRAAQPQPADRIVAMPINAETISRAPVRECFASLLRGAGYGHRNAERAAFLVVSADHSLHCVPWPTTNAYHREAWKGTLPDGTVAIVHTHPAGQPGPSTHDAREAERIGAPIIVLTLEGVSMADSRGRTAILAGQGWMEQTYATTTAP